MERQRLPSFRAMKNKQQKHLIFDSTVFNIGLCYVRLVESTKISSVTAPDTIVLITFYI